MKKITVTFEITITENGNLVVSNIENAYTTYGGGRRIHRIRATSLHCCKYGEVLMTSDCRFYYGKDSYVPEFKVLTCEYDS